MLQPIGAKVLLRPLNDEEKMKKADSGIIIPDSMNKDKEDMRRIVVDFGPDVETDLDEGTRVLITQLGLREKYEEDGQVYEIVKESDILGIIT